MNKNIWPTKKLGEICEERKEKNINNENLPVFTVSHIYGLIPYQNIFYKQVHSKDTKNYKIVNLYDFAFGLPTKDTLPYGLLENEDKVLVSPAYVVFSIKNKNLLFPRFLYYLLKTNYYKWKIIEMAKSQSATRHGLPLKFHHLANLEIPLPPLPIQQKIVKILDTIQSAVEIQEKIIEKTKELKKSLMNLLFHYGIKALSIKELASSRVGELTSSEIEKLGLKLKKTEIPGEIPEDWEVVRLGDIIFNWRSGSVEHVGKSALFNLEGKFTFASFLLRFRPKPNVTNSYFLNSYLNKTRKEGFLKFFAHQASINQSLNASISSNISIPLPTLPEQREIAEILQTIDQKIEIEKKKKELYEELFKTMLNKIMSQEIDVEKVRLE
jgi:type I restriction enzyme S subunit